MKISDLIKSALVLTFMSTLTLVADDKAQPAESMSNSEPAWLQVEDSDLQPRPAATIRHEADAGFSYSAGGNLKQGNRSLGDIDSFNSYVNYTATFPISDGVFGRVGFDWDRHSLNVPDGTLLPNTLQDTVFRVGLDVELSDKWVMRLEAAPGIYSDFQDIGWKDFNIPIILGFSYIVDSKLQWIVGLSADPRREVPVIPAVGVRWQFAEEWTLNLIVPQPRIEYSVDPALSLYAGLDLKFGSYAVSEKQGNPVGQPEINNEILEYVEVRTGVGANYEVASGVTIGAEVGAVVFRNFDYLDDDITIQSTDPAPYGAISIKTRF